jgi:hypothetical protein
MQGTSTGVREQVIQQDVRDLHYPGVRCNQQWRSEAVWSLGRWSRPIAIAWIIFVSPLTIWPVLVYNPAALPTVIGFLAFLLVYFFAWARTRFAGPKVQGGEQELYQIEREFEVAAERYGGATTA